MLKSVWFCRNKNKRRITPDDLNISMHNNRRMFSQNEYLIYEPETAFCDFFCCKSNDDNQNRKIDYSDVNVQLALLSQE